MSRPLARIVLALLAAPLAGCAVSPMPVPTKAAGIAAADQQTIEMDAAGRLTLNGRETTFATLEADLDSGFRATGSAKPRSGQTVLIRAPGEVRYGLFMVLMNNLSVLGWTQTALAEDR